MVYVLNSNGTPLMPTKRYGRVRRLLRARLAVVVRFRPFTIKLTYDTPNIVQEVSLGIDAGSKHVGVSATTPKKVLFEAQLELRTDIVSKLAKRKEFRAHRRSRKTRYRKPRFLNRIRNKKTGWVAPSINHKINCHMYMIRCICKVLPVRKKIVETAKFDIRRLEAISNMLPPPSGLEYQQGDQLGFYNVREYILFRDNHVCRLCNGKMKDPILNVHHIESRKTGGNSPNNLITLCKTCHDRLHNGEIKMPITMNRGKSYRDAIGMNIMRTYLKDRIRLIYGTNIQCKETFGYITKQCRKLAKLPKSHIMDARCISGNYNAVPLGKPWFIGKIRVHNRQIHKANILSGGIRKNNQAPFEVNGYRLMDSVKFKNKIYLIKGRRLTGDFALTDICGNSRIDHVKHNALKLLHRNTGYVMEEVNYTDVCT